jgi:hypothetical protein
MLTRRKVLLGIAGTFGVMSGTLAWRFFRSTDADAMVIVIRKRLDYLSLDEQGLHQFAIDMSARKQLSAGKLRLIPALGPLYFQLSQGHNGVADNLHHGEERLVSVYLLSTDFFANGADESRVVKYMGMYDPLRACGSPFARPIYA